MHDDLFAFTQSIQHFSLQIAFVPDFDNAPVGPVILSDENIPIIPTAKQGAERYS